MVHAMIAAGKRVAGKVKGDKEADAKALQYRIDKLDKEISRVDDEIKHAYDKGAKITSARIAKNFVGYFIAYMEAFALGAGIGALTGTLVYEATLIVFKVPKDLKKFGRELDRAVDKELGLTKTAAKIMAIVGASISAIFAGVSTAAMLSDYEKSLKEWKKNLLEMRKSLENKLKHA